MNNGLSFNPCCNGMSLKVNDCKMSKKHDGFNPCCNGMSLKVKESEDERIRKEF